MNNERTKRDRRAYRPGVEGLEALRLLSGLTAQPQPPVVAIEQSALESTVVSHTEPPPLPSESTELHLATSVTWDTALEQASPVPSWEIATWTAETRREGEAEAVRAGLAQLDRYLSRTWTRAGIPPQKHDDCTQAVYLTLLQHLGRTGFDQLVGEVGLLGIPGVLSRETVEGPDFFRTIDMIKKRAQRERSFHSIDDEWSASSGNLNGQDDWRSTIEDAIQRSLNPREAALIHATLDGLTPAEIAQEWGVAPKTVSNEKTRAYQKLRDFLGAELAEV